MHSYNQIIFDSYIVLPHPCALALSLIAASAINYTPIEASWEASESTAVNENFRDVVSLSLL